MATNSSQLQETILKAIDAVVTQRNNDLKLDKTIIGTIKKNIGKRGTKPLYQVEYSGGIIEAVAQSVEDMYSPHTGVYVLVPQGNFSNEKIIVGRTSAINTDRTASVVAAAVNNYSIVGANLLTTTEKTNTPIKDLKFGLHSFHPAFRDNIHGIEHRAQFIYQKNNENNKITFDDNRLNIYKEESTAIMIKADFLTNLDSIQKQQPNARYGLIFSFAFDNLNKSYGETNGEILGNISQIVKGKIFNDEGVLIERSLSFCVEYLQNHFETDRNKNLAYFINTNTGIIDQTIEMIRSIYDCFKIDNAKLDNEIINNTIQAYLSLLNELKYKQTINSMLDRYNEWITEIVGDEAQKYIQFVLSSDDMIGNPFNFNTWNTQYSVFNIDLETFNHLESILFYKEGFFTDTEETNYESQWPIGTNGEPDIFVKNIQIYAMNPLDNQSGDYTLNVEPYAGSDIFVSLDNSSTQFKATLLRKHYENLTANAKTSFFWFKEDPTVINTKSRNYHYLGGSGWRKLEHKETNYLFTTTVNDNFAYKNNYKCVAVYEPSVDDKTILSFTFSVYNKDIATDIKLESDLGTDFSFDAGKPTIRILINEDRNLNNEYIEYAGTDEKYLYCWTINDAANGYTLFLDEVFDVLEEENNSVQEAILLSSKQSLLKRIETFTLNEPAIDAAHATRIKYPVAVSSSGFTATCYVKQKRNGQYYDIGSASLDFTNQNDSIAPGYRIHIVNGDQVFQYDEYGNTPCSEKKKDPLIIQPLKAKLFTPSGLEVEGTNYQIEWIFPIESTMIKTSETLHLNPSTDLIQVFRGPEVNFSINDLYDPNAYANQITCHIHFGDSDYYKDTNFYFGKQGNNGTNGTDTVAKIEFAGEDPTNILHYQPLTLYVQKRNLSSSQGMWNIGQKSLQDKILLAKTDFLDSTKNTGIFKVSIYQKQTLIDSENYKPGYPKWNIAGNANAANNTCKFFELINSQDDSNLYWDYNFNQDTIYRMQNIKAEVQLSDEQMYYAFFSLPIIEYEPAAIELPSILPTNRISIDRNYYLNEIVYNQDGRNPVYNHNQGLRLYNLPSNITKIIWTAKGGLVNGEVKPCISLLEEKDLDEGFTVLETIPEKNSSMVYVLPNDIFNGSATNNRIEATLYNNNKLIATVYAPINMTLNTFGLTSLNAWDGNTVTIDEEGGYIMAPQIGAGEKDANNRFTGVLMGKTETYTGGGDLEEEIGLFGYANGLQSIFLDSKTGNATFGLPDVYNTIDKNGNPIKIYQNTTRISEDDYGEGRIELRPGDVSKVGGWRLGRRSLYYTMTPDPSKDIYKDALDEDGHPIIDENGQSIKVLTQYGYSYHGQIGDRYQNDRETPKRRQYADHHEKDITYKDSGILISANPSYLSIVGGILAQPEISEDANGHLIEGDAIEMQLDPKTPTVFTIFRHNGDNRGDIRGTRTYLAGINPKGQLQANAVGSAGDANNQTTMYIGRIKAFEQAANEEPAYVGAVFEAGDSSDTLPFINFFMHKDKLVNEHGQIQTNAHVYITGGDFNPEVDHGGENYSRDFSLHGNAIQFYAKDSLLANNDKPFTDANIQISTNEAQINLGESTQLFLHRTVGTENKPNINTLKTSGAFNWIVGAGQEKQQLTITAKELEETYDSISQTVARTTIINNGGSYTLNAKDTIGLFRKSSATDNTYSQLTLTNESATFGLPTDKSFISLYSGVDENNTWKSEGKISLISTRSSETSTFGGENIFIHANVLGSGISHNNTTLPQIELRAGTSTEDINIKEKAGTVARLLMSSSNSNWKGTQKGIPFSLVFSTSKKEQESSSITQWLIETFTQDVKQNDVTISDVRYWQNRVGMNQYIAGGLKVDGPYLGQGEEKGDARGTIQGIQMRAGLRIDASGLQYYEVPGTILKFWQWGGIKSDVFWGTGFHSFCDGDSTIGGSGTVGWGQNDSATGTFTAVELQSDGRPRLYKQTMKVSVPDAEEIYTAIKESISTQISTALNGYAKTSDLENYLKKNTAYTYDTAVMTHTTAQGTAINGRNVLTDVIDHTTSTFKVH